LNLLKKLSALVLALALVTVSCSSSGSSVVASVGGVDVTESDLGDFFESDALPIDESLRQGIFALVAREVLEQALLADFGVALDVDQVEEIRGEMAAQMEEAGLTPEEFLGVPDASLEMLRFNAEIGVIREQAIDALVRQPETFEFYFSDPLAYTTVCARHILVDSADEAETVSERLEGGEDFAEVATEISLDTATPGGDLGCSLAFRYVPEFARATVEAEIGALVGPVETEFGFHLIIVDERRAPTTEEIQADPAAYMADTEIGSLWNGWFNGALDEAEVELDEKYGTWTDVGILPPDAEPVTVPTDG
jgi:parvulin-like peptidyl-prolyl isomerase